VPNSYDTLQKLKDLLADETYGYATAVVTYCETKSLTLNYIGMAEFRDALTHVQRAIYATEESIAQDEINSAYEHIRRAAVESMQEYVELRYANIRKRLLIPNYKYYFARYQKPDYKKIKEFEDNIKNNIISARNSKPHKEWQEAIGYFIEAEKEIDKLDELLPPYKDLQERYSNSILIILGIIFTLFVVLSIFR